MTAKPLVRPSDVDVQTLVMPLPQGVEMPSTRTSSKPARRRVSSAKKTLPLKSKSDVDSNINRPDGSRMTQQQLHMWEPVLTLGWSIGICLSLAVLCIGLGVLIVYTSGTLTKLRVIYDGDADTQASSAIQPDGNITQLSNCRLDSPNQANSFHADHTCFVHLTLANDIKSPVRVFYELDGYYQNHRRFVSSIIRTQFTDEWSPATATSMLECYPMRTVSSQLCTVGICEPTSAAMQREYFPCGIVANTLFNDIFWLHEGVLPTGENLSRTDMTSRGIARTYAAHNNKNPTWNLSTDAYLPVWLNPNMSLIIPPPDGPTNPQIYADYTNSTAWVHDALDPDYGVGVGLENEFWRVWVEGAAMHPFLKPYGRIEHDLPAGTNLTFAVQSNFFVRSFNGSKALVIEEVGWFGSGNYVLGAFFFGIGGVFGVAAIFFAGCKLHHPRALGDAAALAWKKK
ncbi:Protein kinase [Phytophthora megakarya]|uniref:Protein kinase n=1 Tax=Phytophthora megakarya TaxID=4795 RepID=A0A225VIL1_9STRA|nr:Protein kinase [Phytophthora megakarya]